MPPPPRSTLFPYTTLFRSGLHDDAVIEPAARWIRSQQREDGTWANYFGGPGDLSTTVEAYLALRLVGLDRSEEHTSELQSRQYLVCRLLLEKKKKKIDTQQ